MWHKHLAAVDKHRQLILDAMAHIWRNPEPGYREWKTQEYMRAQFEALGYEFTLAGNIPGFYTDVDTGRPGPKLCIMAELDALDLATHPEAVNGMAHACGHHGQMAALLGIAAALKEPGALEGLCGSIRLMVVPAEEMIQLGFREELRQKGELTQLKGLLYFTDGKGTFPAVKPPYETAFILHHDGWDTPPIPQWAIQLTLTEDEILDQRFDCE